MILSNENFLKCAMRAYDNPQCVSLLEFEEDLKKFTYLHKLLKRYSRTGVLKERLILNHIIILYNLFGQTATDMLFLKIDEEHWSALVTFLIYLRRIPEEKMAEIPVDSKIVSVLRGI